MDNYTYSEGNDPVEEYCWRHIEVEYKILYESTNSKQQHWK